MNCFTAASVMWFGNSTSLHSNSYNSSPFGLSSAGLDILLRTVPSSCEGSAEDTRGGDAIVPAAIAAGAEVAVAIAATEAEALEAGVGEVAGVERMSAEGRGVPILSRESSLSRI